MANPGHALASNSFGEIQRLERELTLLRAKYQMAMTHLSNALKEVMELLESKGMISANEIQSLESLNIFRSMNHQQNLW